jgi:putative Ca2+/H+ antiporter (TMEM165/GDT1 family)
MTWGKDRHLWECIIAGVVMAATWMAMTGGPLPAPLTPALLNAIGIAGAALLLVCGAWLMWRRRHMSRV